MKNRYTPLGVGARWVERRGDEGYLIISNHDVEFSGAIT